MELDMILRDHDKNILAKRKQLLLDLAAFMNNKYGTGSVECSLQDMYCNMKEYITPVFEIVERAENDEAGGTNRRKTISEVLQDIFDDKVN